MGMSVSTGGGGRGGGGRGGRPHTPVWGKKITPLLGGVVGLLASVFLVELGLADRIAGRRHA